MQFATDSGYVTTVTSALPVKFKLVPMCVDMGNDTFYWAADSEDALNLCEHAAHCLELGVYFTKVVEDLFDSVTFLNRSHFLRNGTRRRQCGLRDDHVFKSSLSSEHYVFAGMHIWACVSAPLARIMY